MNLLLLLSIVWLPLSMASPPPGDAHAETDASAAPGAGSTASDGQPTTDSPPVIATLPEPNEQPGAGDPPAHDAPQAHGEPQEQDAPPDSIEPPEPVDPPAHGEPPAHDDAPEARATPSPEAHTAPPLPTTPTAPADEPPVPSPVYTTPFVRSLPGFTGSAEDWLETFLPDAPDAAPASPTEMPALLPSPSDLVAHGPDVVQRRLLWLLAAVLTGGISARFARRRHPGPIRRLLDRVTALARSAAIVTGIGASLALLPTAWLPWVLLISASAAVAVGWSLRPVVADILAGLYLGITGRHSPGASVQLAESRGVLHRPGALYSVVQAESGALETIPNRKLAIVARRAWRSGRRPLQISVPVAVDADPSAVLAAILWVSDLLPWTAADAPRVHPPIPGNAGHWTVELVVLGDSPPVERVQVLFPRLVADVLQRGKDTQAPHAPDG